MINVIKWFLCLVLFTAYPANATTNILIIGDSLSAAYGMDAEKSWVSLLQKRLDSLYPDYKVHNTSITGSTTSNGLASLPQALEQYQPKITIIELGGNDGLRGIPLETIQTQLGAMIELAKKNQSKVLLLGVRLPPNYGPAYTDKFQAMYIRLAKQHEVSVIPLFLKDIDSNPKFMQADGIHPLDIAQPKMLDNVWICLEPLLQNQPANECIR